MRKIEAKQGKNDREYRYIHESFDDVWQNLAILRPLNN